MSRQLMADLAERTQDLHEEGLYKSERVIASPQGAHIELEDGSDVLNFCANNYLGLADHPRLVEAAKRALDDYGYGMASVRFICGTQTVHRRLERRLSERVSSPPRTRSSTRASTPTPACSRRSSTRTTP
jgi:glycine C-acetyltransferase